MVTMSNLKCPFCQQELEEETFSGGRVFVSCNNPNCIISDWGGCSKQIITELIRTRKALDVAVDALKKYKSDSGNWWYGYEFQGHYEDYAGEYADKALEQITALEQKDVK